MDTLHVDYETALWKEFVGEEQSLVQITAGIVPKIEYQPGHACLQQSRHSRRELGITGSGELGEFHISGRIVYHVGHINTLDRYLVAGHIELDHLPVAHDVQVHDRA